MSKIKNHFNQESRADLTPFFNGWAPFSLYGENSNEAVFDSGWSIQSRALLGRDCSLEAGPCSYNYYHRFAYYLFFIDLGYIWCTNNFHSNGLLDTVRYFVIYLVFLPKLSGFCIHTKVALSSISKGAYFLRDQWKRNCTTSAIGRFSYDSLY